MNIKRGIFTNENTALMFIRLNKESPVKKILLLEFIWWNENWWYYEKSKILYFSHQNNPENVSLSFKTDWDVGVCLKSEDMSSNKINPLYTGRVFHCCMLDESICHFRGVGSVLLLLFYFWWKILLANNVDPGQMPHCVESDQGLHCLPMTLLRIFR